MSMISPLYKRKVTKESFKELTNKNSILKNIKELYVAQRKRAIHAKVGMTPQRMRLTLVKETEKCITLLVVKLRSTFTTPDMMYIK